MKSVIRCVIHGSFGRNFNEIQAAKRLFEAAGVEVLAPNSGKLVGDTDGFALFEDEIGSDPREIELRYLHNLRRLGPDGFSYFVNPDGYMGKSASYELGVAQLTNIRCLFQEPPVDHPAYVPRADIWSAESLAHYIAEHGTLPPIVTHPDERAVQRLLERLVLPGSVVATGAIIEHKVKDKQEILLVKTHKWGGRYSIVGGKVKRNERLESALLREVQEETGLKGKVGRHIITFDQIKNSGYYKQGVQYVFVDNVVKVNRKKVILNDEAQDYLWVTANEALSELDIEPNARKTVKLYANLVA